MAIPVVFGPKADVDELATITRWHAAPGDQVQASEPLLEVEAEKVSYDIPAPASGRLLEILALVGDEITSGMTLALIEET